MSNVRLSSNFFISLFAAAALTTSVGCGGSSSSPSDGGTGARDGGGTGGGGGRAGTGGTGGGGGTVGTGGQGTGGGATGGGGGRSNTGGSGTGGGNTGGAAGTGTGGRGAGGNGPCGDTQICTVGAKRCQGAAPATVQTCAANASTGCNEWQVTDTCGQRETCTAPSTTAASCACNNDPACMAMTGDFCTAGKTMSFSTCSRDADSCLFVSTMDGPCAAGQSCTKTAGMIQPTGMACGCPAAVNNPGPGVVLIDKGCTMAQVGTQISSPGDDEVLVCTLVGACYVWRDNVPGSVNCRSQQLTAGTNVINNQPNCVCKLPRPTGIAETDQNFSGKAGVLYVDPQPDQASLMTNQPTGAEFPAACRLRRLNAANAVPVGALNQAAASAGKFTKVVAESARNNAHFNQEDLPVAIPANIELTTSDNSPDLGRSFDPKHYVIDLNGSGRETDTTTDLTHGARVTLGNGSKFSGFSLLGPTRAPLNVVGGWTTPDNTAGSIGSETDLLGCGGTASAQISFLYIIGTGRTGPANTGIAVNGACTLTATQIDIFDVNTGVEVDYTGTTGKATFTGSFIRVRFPDGQTAQTPGAGSFGMVVADANSQGDLTDSLISVGINVIAGGENPTTQRGVGVMVGGDTIVPNASGGLSTLLRTSIYMQDETSAAGDSVINGAYGVLVAPPITATATPVALLTSTVVNVTDSSVTMVHSNAGAASSDGTDNTVPPAPITTGTLTAIDNDLERFLTQDAAFNNIPATINTLATGLWFGAGTDTMTNVKVTVGTQTHGVAASAGAHLTINGGAQAAIDNTCAPTPGNITGCGTRTNTFDNVTTSVAGSTSSHAIYVPAGDPAASPAGFPNNLTSVTINGPATIQHFERGIDQNEGTLSITGTGANAVTVTANTDDGIRLYGQLPTSTTFVTLTGLTVSKNAGEGIDVATKTQTALTGITSTANAGSGVDVHLSQNTNQSGYQIRIVGQSQITGNGRRGIFLSGTMGKVGARIETSTISGNHLEGIRVSEAAADAAGSGPPPATPPVFTEVLVEDNTISGNMIELATAPTQDFGGGFFIASADTLVPTATPTRVALTSFLGNTVLRNGRDEIGFATFQQNTVTLAAPGPAPASPAWDLSSDQQGVDAAAICSAAAKPNTVTCYDHIVTPIGEDLAVAIPPDLQIPVKVKGMHWQYQNQSQGKDFSGGPLGIINQQSCSISSCPMEPDNGVFLSCAPVLCPAQ